MRALIIVGAISTIILVSAASFILGVSEDTIYLGILIFFCAAIVFSLFMYYFLTRREKKNARKKLAQKADAPGASEHQDDNQGDERNYMNLPSSVLRTSMAPSVLDPDFNNSDSSSGSSEYVSGDSDYSRDSSDSNNNEGW